MGHADGMGGDPSHAPTGMTAHDDAFPDLAAELQPSGLVAGFRTHKTLTRIDVHSWALGRSDVSLCGANDLAMEVG